jgi:hypothetical protein
MDFRMRACQTCTLIRRMSIEMFVINVVAHNMHENCKRSILFITQPLPQSRPKSESVGLGFKHARCLDSFGALCDFKSGISSSSWSPTFSGGRKVKFCVKRRASGRHQ